MKIGGLCVYSSGVAKETKKTRRGWCSLQALLAALSWDIGQGCTGVGATHRHDGKPFDPIIDADLLARAGKNLGFVTPVVQLRGDWPAICELLGFRQWAHSKHPCLMCKTSKFTMTSDAALHNVSCTTCPDGWYTREDYDAEVRGHGDGETINMGVSIASLLLLQEPNDKAHNCGSSSHVWELPQLVGFIVEPRKCSNDPSITGSRYDVIQRLEDT